uniref:Uncharacterized protein n=1 Tax=Rhizophora mucronata TaxID=61149 RepID=A0A2P2QPE2_RHIMU
MSIVVICLDNHVTLSELGSLTIGCSN